MLKINKTGLVLDTIFSYEGGVPVGTNIMATGDPGVGKTTVLLHTLASLQLKNPNLKCLFVCAEMSQIQMFKYTQRFPIFGNLETIFTSDFMNYNSKEVIEQLFKKGYDYILIDSIVEVLESVKEDASMSQSQAEKWLVDLCVEHNEANNELGKYTSFLLIQQVTKAGVFVGSNKIKHITDAHMELKREGEREGGGTYIMFSKNRNGQAGIKFTYQLNNQDIHYGTLVEEKEEEEDGEYTLNS
jgi:DNA repair protein RadA/Sms